MVRCDICRFVIPRPRHTPARALVDELVTSHSIRPGTLLRDRYEIVQELGRGEHGITHLAHHIYINHPCVVKVLHHPVKSATEATARRLQAEASAGFKVSHPNVVRVLDCDTHDGYWYVVMEYIDGVDLTRPLQNKLRLDWRQAISVAVDAAAGLEAIHCVGMVHRDIKPGNLILGTDGRTRVADLGVVGILGSDADPATQLDTGSNAGSFGYAAPEILSHRDKVGPAADLYSLGASLFQLITGRSATRRSRYAQFLDADMQPPAWPTDVPSDVPGWFVEVILKLLQPEPQRRFSSAREVKESLGMRTDSRVSPPRPRMLERGDPRGFVVLAFENQFGSNADDWLGSNLADHLARSLSQRPSVYVVNREQFHATLDRVTARGNANQLANLLDAGRMCGARAIIRGTFTKRDDTIEISATVHESGRGEPIAFPPAKGHLSTLALLEDDLDRRLAAALGLATAPDLKPQRRGPLVAEEKFIAAKELLKHGSYEQAGELAAEAVQLDPEFGEAIGLVGICCARLGQYERAIETNQRQQSLANRLGDQRLLAESYANRGTMHYFRGEYEAARDWLQRSVELASSLGLMTDVAMVRNNLGFVQLQLKQPAAAAEMFNLAIETHTSNGAKSELIPPFTGIGHVMREQRKFDEARVHFRRALVLAEEINDDVNIGVSNMNLGHCALLQGRVATAKYELLIALNVLEKTGFLNGLARVYEYMAELNLEIRNGEEAVRCAERRIELAQRQCNSRMLEAAWMQKAAGLRQCGRMVEADACMGQMDRLR
ncbi:MAG: protein kinase domain-containing protein [Phycisphaerae bacterium]